jgi:hypothetical protein
MTQTEALRLALEALTDALNKPMWNRVQMEAAITAVEAAQEAKDEPWEQFYPGMGKPYGFEASMYSNDRIKVDVVTGNVSIGTVTKPCGLECDCTDVCKQDDYKALWQQMCERCDELDKKLAQQEPNYKKALEVWLDKTEWVQETVKPHELGMHRADVLKQRIEEALAQPEHGWTPERIAGMARLKAQQDKRLEPQRTWVGLTDEEIWACLPKDPDEMVFARAIEAKLKQKNFKE